MEITTPLVLKLGIGEGEWSASRSSRLATWEGTLGDHWIGG